MKTVRLRTKFGEVRYTSLAPFADLPSWWHETKFRDGVIGNNWCLPFNQIAAADLVDVQDSAEIPSDQLSNAERIERNRDQIARMAAGIGAGLWVPPGEKQ
jgi:hypothetical protein